MQRSIFLSLLKRRVKPYVNFLRHLYKHVTTPVNQLALSNRLPLRIKSVLTGLINIRVKTKKNLTNNLTRRKFLNQSSKTCMGLLSANLYQQLCAQHLPNPNIANIIALRIWPANDSTRITLESQTPVIQQYQLLNQPLRLVLDIQSNQLPDLLSTQAIAGKIKSHDPNIQSVQGFQYDFNTVRLVFFLKQPINFKSFNMAPIATYQHRAIFDLYGPQIDADDPLAKSIKQLNHKTANTNINANKTINNADDPLQDFIANHNAQASAATTQKGKRRYTIMLDPGHGGEDPGAVGSSGSYEKNIVLSIAHYVRQLAQPHVNVRMTRDDDFFVPLAQRVLKARKANADAFISIHADAALNPAARGSSTFILSEKGASSAMARMLAKNENAVDAVGGVSDKDAQIQHLLWGLSTEAQIRESQVLASLILGNIAKINKLHQKQVERAGFAVLKSPSIPSVLVETAFLSNPEEEAKLNDKSYQYAMANAIWQGIKRYLRI